jgi:ATP/maltotriose-dependent transcriptional regulator MalT
VRKWPVQRPRISKLIADGTRRCSLTVLTGPPGAGETMALALWAAAESRTVAWVSLDEFDNWPEMRSNAWPGEPKAGRDARQRGSRRARNSS